MAIKYAVLIGSILSRNVDASKVLSQSDEPALSVPHFNLNEVMSDEEFANTEFIVLSQQQQLNTGADSRSKVNEVEILAQGATGSSSSLAATDSGVVCETVCRPRQSSAGGVPQEAQTAFIETGHQEDAERVTQPIESQSLKELELRFASQLDDMARSFNRTLCSATGGSWVESTSTCAPFMQASNVAVSACDGSGIFDACSNGVDTTADLDVEYIPCSPFQALSLAHLQKDWVPDQSYFWLWAGGREDQVQSAAFKQDIGHNPVSGLDKCATGDRIGMFHNWDGNHVDSWSCLDCSHQFQVLCCRR